MPSQTSSQDHYLKEILGSIKAAAVTQRQKDIGTIVPGCSVMLHHSVSVLTDIK